VPSTANTPLTLGGGTPPELPQLWKIPEDATTCEHVHVDELPVDPLAVVVAPTCRVSVKTTHPVCVELTVTVKSGWVPLSRIGVENRNTTETGHVPPDAAMAVAGAGNAESARGLATTESNSLRTIGNLAGGRLTH